ncbi:DUF1348 family protein [Hymenobacter terricola]|uniref:DUF1348 family protein n=1 Tax=Hymenobacter terricola TaxID=2819236 RepID=UPI001CF450CD|nr:DUF1348 family protein [Hymenobacter terricola]
MNSPDATPEPEEEAPFVHEECGDTMWDAVLAQPPYAPTPPALRPPFTAETAQQKVRQLEDGWNTRNPKAVGLLCSLTTEWRERADLLTGRGAVEAFLTEKWATELGGRLALELWNFHENRMAVRTRYEYHNAAGQWYRADGNELWQFDAGGLLQRREASSNEVAILETKHGPL